MADRSRTFCPLPWIHQLVSERGRIFPCAFSMESGEALRSESGAYYSAAEAEEAWNSLAMRDLRKSLLRGEAPKNCSRCFRLEELGVPSLREVSNRHFGHLAEALLSETAEDGSAPRSLLAMDLRFGNFCNLRCRMCSPESSVKITEEFRAIYPNLSNDYFAELANLDWFRSEPARKVLLKNAPTLRELHFAGGEPFLIPEVAAFLEELVETGEGKHITLTFNTNLTLLPEKILNLWPQFERVKVFVSLDGVGTVNDYIRFPSKFAAIDKNLHFLDDNFTDLACSLVCFNSTIQMYNILSVEELVEYTTKSFKNFLPFPILSPLFWPEPFCIDVLSAELKKTAAQRLRNLIEKNVGAWKALESRCDYPDGANRFIRNIEGLIRLMEARDRSELLPEFTRITEAFDKTRNQNRIRL